VKVDGYIRVSKVGGRMGPSFISPQLQQEEIEAWARFKGAELAEIHIDLDESGSKLNRPGIEKAITRIEAGETEGIVVAKLDRFARSLIGALETIKRLDRAGAIFISVAEGLDPTTPAGKMMMRMMLVMAEFELDRITDTWEQSRRKAVSRGLHLAARPPTGYLRGPKGTLVPDPTMAPQIARCFQMRAEYRSWPEIVTYLEENSAGGTSVPKRWKRGTLMDLIANRVYLGEARSGPHVKVAAHPPLVDRGTWETAQLTRTLTVQSSGHPGLLAGLARCAGCRYVMAPGGDKLRSGEVRRRYWCQGRSPGGPCLTPSKARGMHLEPEVEARFFELYESSSTRRRARESSRRKAGEILEDAERSLSELESAQSAADPESLLGAQAAVETARARVVDLTRSTFLPSPSQLRRRWPKMSVPERRRAIALLIDAVMVHPDPDRLIADRVRIVPFGSSAVSLPSRREKGSPMPFPWEDGALR
jgi:site-specific DNA recombinase